MCLWKSPCHWRYRVLLSPNRIRLDVGASNMLKAHHGIRICVPFSCLSYNQEHPPQQGQSTLVQFTSFWIELSQNNTIGTVPVKLVPFKKSLFKRTRPFTSVGIIPDR
mmetsp:Transcript_16562/g.28078  ORF Transcript_16562/g.28078 Transcript_16562/m.28078 type:complete len:108 (+) Transcript_16562:501-824(+)